MNYCTKFLYRQFSFSFKRFYGSVLFIPGNQASKTCAVVTPCLDFDSRFNNIERLETNIKLRNLDINTGELKKAWDLYKTLEKNITDLETRRLEIASQIKTVSSESSSESNVENLKVHAREIKENMKKIKVHVWDLEEKAILKMFQLPNDLHHDTPYSESKIVYTFKEKPQNKSESHIAVGEKLNVIKYYNSIIYYLMNDAALYELGAMFYATDFFVKKGFIVFSNVDFSKSVVVEGCGLNTDDVITLENTENNVTTDQNFLHVTGSASLISYMAYHTKNLIHKTSFPLKYICVGRQYNKVDENENGLFHVCQSVCAEIFIATIDDDERLNSEFKSILSEITELYENLNYHFRIRYKSAKELKNFESLCASFEMYSCYLDEYVEVGCISICDNFISKRLQFCYSEDKVRKYPKVISATVMNFPKFLACILEQTSDNVSDFIPPVIKNFVQ